MLATMLMMISINDIDTDRCRHGNESYGGNKGACQHYIGGENDAYRGHGGNIDDSLFDGANGCAIMMVTAGWNGLCGSMAVLTAIVTAIVASMVSMNIRHHHYAGTIITTS